MFWIRSVPIFIQELSLNHSVHVGLIRFGGTNGREAYCYFFFCLLECVKGKGKQEGGRRGREIWLWTCIRGYPVHISADSVEGPKELWFCLCGVMDTHRVHDFSSVPACPVEMVIKSRYFLFSSHHSGCEPMQSGIIQTKAWRTKVKTWREQRNKYHSYDICVFLLHISSFVPKMLFVKELHLLFAPWCVPIFVPLNI